MASHDACAEGRNSPCDIEQREANAVFDEDGEVLHFFHWRSKSEQRNVSSIKIFKHF